MVENAAWRVPVLLFQLGNTSEQAERVLITRPEKLESRGKSTMRLLPARSIACLIVGCLSVNVIGTEHRPLQTERQDHIFPAQALALRAADAIHDFGKARIKWVRQYEASRAAGWASDFALRSPVSLPRYAGAGETSVHKAIREAERLLQAGQPAQALTILVELVNDLNQALETHRIERLMDTWNARFPSDAPVDIVGEAHLQAFIEAACEVWRRFIREQPRTEEDPETHTRDDAEDESFVARVRQGMGPALERAAADAGYDSAEDLLRDYMDADQIKTQFAVYMSPTFADRLGEKSPAAVVVAGVTTVTRIILALERRYPALRTLNWSLRIDGRAAESMTAVILPSQRLEIVLVPETGSGMSGGGPGGSPLSFGAFRLFSWPRSLPIWLASLGRQITHQTRGERQKTSSPSSRLYRAA